MKPEVSKSILNSLTAVLLTFALGVLAFSFGKVVWKTKCKRSEKVQTLPTYAQVPEFILTERNTKTVSLSDLKGKVWIANFMFTHCAGICPLMSNKMKSLQETLSDSFGIRFVSFSVDPERDTPEVLSRYAERYQADPIKWFFLTGDKKTIYNLSAQHFHLGVEEIPQEKKEDLDQSVQHSSKFVLVDIKGKIRGYYDSENPTALEQLVKDAESLLGEASKFQ